MPSPASFAHHCHRVRPRSAPPVVAYYPDVVAKAYGFPTGLVSSGITIGLIELGGSDYASDLQTFCQTRNLPLPALTRVLVNGATVQPDPQGADVEVMLDIEAVASSLPGCKIRVYYAGNTTADFIAAVKQALAECDVVSCSWGAPEDQYAAADLQTFEAAIAAGPAPFLVASGDSGSTDGETGKQIDCPASCPSAIACGGTTLPALTGGLPNLAAETAWSDSGGGISSVFAKPSYQSGESISGSMRGSPDVAACADPNTPYQIYCNAQWMQVGGTSAAAPLLAGLLGALKVQAGNLPSDPHPLFYGPGACRDITSGSNGSYSAGVGYDLVTGNGVPIPAQLLYGIEGSTPPPSPPAPPAPPAPPPPAPPAPPAPVSVKQQILQIIDDAFAAAEALAAGNPHDVHALERLQAFNDTVLLVLLDGKEAA